MLTPRASSTIPMCIYLTDILAPERDALLASPPFPSSFSSFSSLALDRMNAACFPCASTHRSSDRFFNSPSRDCIFSRDVDSAEATIEDHVDITSESLYVGREGRGRSEGGEEGEETCGQSTETFTYGSRRGLRYGSAMYDARE